jgi:hypothetical protein
MTRHAMTVQQEQEALDLLQSIIGSWQAANDFGRQYDGRRDAATYFRGAMQVTLPQIDAVLKRAGRPGMTEDQATELRVEVHQQKAICEQMLAKYGEPAA